MNGPIFTDFRKRMVDKLNAMFKVSEGKIVASCFQTVHDCVLTKNTWDEILAHGSTIKIQPIGEVQSTQSSADDLTMSKLKSYYQSCTECITGDGSAAFYKFLCEVYRVTFTEVLDNHDISASGGQDGTLSVTLLRSGTIGANSNANTTATPTRSPEKGAFKQFVNRLSHVIKALYNYSGTSYADVYIFLHDKFDMNLYFNSFVINKSWLPKLRQVNESLFIANISDDNNKLVKVKNTNEQLAFSCIKIASFYPKLMNVIEQRFTNIDKVSDEWREIMLSDATVRLAKIERHISNYYSSITNLRRESTETAIETFIHNASMVCLHTEDVYMSIGGNHHVLFLTQHNSTVDYSSIKFPKEYFMMSIFDNIGMMLEYCVKHYADADEVIEKALHRPFLKYITRCIHALGKIESITLPVEFNSITDSHVIQNIPPKFVKDLYDIIKGTFLEHQNLQDDKKSLEYKLYKDEIEYNFESKSIESYMTFSVTFAWIIINLIPNT